MTKGRARAATVGVTEHGNSAVLVSVGPHGELLDRRRVVLTERGLPTHPHHHEGSWAMGRYLGTPGARAIALRRCPPLPPTIEQRIADNRAQTVADSAMYRQELATAAQARGWSVHWYDRPRVLRDAARALGCDDVVAALTAMGKSLGPPWQAAHKLAAAAALAARESR